jgi:hypothetical protein
VKSSVNTADTVKCEEKLEARVGIEPTYKGFADLSLTTWVPRPLLPKLASPTEIVHPLGQLSLHGKGPRECEAIC